MTSGWTMASSRHRMGQWASYCSGVGGSSSRGIQLVKIRHVAVGAAEIVIGKIHREFFVCCTNQGMLILLSIRPGLRPRSTARHGIGPSPRTNLPVA